MKKISTKQKISLITFGLFLCVILLEGGLRIGGFLYISLQEYRNIKSLKQKGEYRILCLGESTTANQWPGPLEDILNQSNIGVKFSVIDKGVPVTNTGAIVTHLTRYLDTYKPHMVVTMMGENDSSHHFVLPDQPGKISFKTLRIYKFLRLLILHISAKCKEISSSFKKKRELIDITNQRTIKEAEDLKLEKEEEKEIGKDDLSEERYIGLGAWYIEQGKLDKAEAAFKEAITINPKNERGYIELGLCYRGQGKLDKAEAVFKEVITINPGNEWGYIDLGLCYRGQGKLDKAAAEFKGAIKINPKNERGYIELGLCYRGQGKFDEAAAKFKEAIIINPKNEDAYTELGQCYRYQGKLDKVEAVFKEAIKINPKRYNELGLWYIEQGKLDKAAAKFKEAIIINPKNEDAYIGLGQCYRYQGKFDQAEAVFNEAIKINPKNEWTYIALGWCYTDQGNLDKAGEVFKEAIIVDPENEGTIHNLTKYKQDNFYLNHQRENTDKPLFGFYTQVTVTNYKKLKSIVTRNNIPLVCVQYPIRSVEPLKKMFKNREGMVFVDNEGVFKEALKGVSHTEYFTDMFGGDFGHCTFKGNQLLAKNIADTILDEYFNKEVK